MQMKTARIFDLQRATVHDGPGIRTTVFFKGCNLRCAWCHNPEAQKPEAQILHHEALCIGCGRCLGLCEARVLQNGKPTLCREKCSACGRCANICPSDALQRAGEDWTIDRVIESVLRDKALFDASGGGVTLSGGEPMLQIDAVEELLKGLCERGVSTAIDTAGNVPWAYFERVLNYTDLFLYDLKDMDSARHKMNTGVGNERILCNLRRLSQIGRVWVRMPLIETVNTDSVETHRAVAFLDTLDHIERVDLLPYHTLGRDKYIALDLPFRRFTPPGQEALSDILALLKNAGFRATISVTQGKAGNV